MRNSPATLRELLAKWGDEPTQRRFVIYAARKIRALSWSSSPPEPAEVVNTVHLKMLSGTLRWDASRVGYEQMLYVCIKSEVHKQYAKGEQQLVQRVDPLIEGAFDGVALRGEKTQPGQDDQLAAQQELMRFLQSLKSIDHQLFNYVLQIADQDYGSRRDHKRIAAALGISVVDSYKLAARLERHIEWFLAGEAPPVAAKKENS